MSFFKKILPILALAAMVFIPGPQWSLLAKFAFHTFIAVSTAIITRPKTAEKYKAKDRKQMVRTTNAPRTIVYGRARVSGPIVFAESTGSQNKYLHLIVCLAGHEVDEIEEVWVNDKAVILTATGLVTSTPYANDGYVKRTYEITDLSMGTHNINLPEVLGYIVDSVDNVVLEDGENSSDNYPYSTRNDGTAVTIILQELVTRVTIHYTEINPSLVTSSLLRIIKHNGSSPGLADSTLISECSLWTSEHRLREIAYLYVRLEFNPSKNVTSIPNISAVVRGKKIYNPTTSTTVWSDNWALVIRDYLTASYGLNCSSTEIDSDSLSASVLVSDEELTIPEGEIKKYTINGVVSLDEKPIDVIQQMVKSGAGSLIYSQGTYKIVAGGVLGSLIFPAGELGVVVFSEDSDSEIMYSEDQSVQRHISETDFSGSLKIRAKVPRNELINGIRCTYTSPVTWAEAEITPISVAEYVVQDNNEDIKGDLSLPYTTNVYAAKNLAAIHLKIARRNIVVNAICNLRLIDVTVNDLIGVSIPHLIWDDKLFRVQQWKLDAENEGISLILQEENDDDFNYDLDLVTKEATIVTPYLKTPFDTRTVPPPSLLEVRLVRGGIGLLTAYPTYQGYLHSEIVRNTTDSRTSAIIISKRPYPDVSIVDQWVDSNTRYFYWIRFFNSKMESSDWYPKVSGVSIVYEDAEIIKLLRYLPDSSNIEINLSEATFFTLQLTMYGTTTISIINSPTNNRVLAFTIEVDAGTGSTILWPPSVKWPGGISPVLTIADGKKDVFTLYTYDTGVTWTGIISGQNI